MKLLSLSPFVQYGLPNLMKGLQLWRSICQYVQLERRWTDFKNLCTGEKSSYAPLWKSQILLKFIYTLKFWWKSGDNSNIQSKNT